MCDAFLLLFLLLLFLLLFLRPLLVYNLPPPPSSSSSPSSCSFVHNIFVLFLPPLLLFLPPLPPYSPSPPSPPSPTSSSSSSPPPPSSSSCDCRSIRLFSTASWYDVGRCGKQRSRLRRLDAIRDEKMRRREDKERQLKDSLDCAVHLHQHARRAGCNGEVARPKYFCSFEMDGRGEGVRGREGERREGREGGKDGGGERRAKGGGCTQFVHDRSRKTIGLHIATVPGRRTSGFHQPDRHGLHQARSAVRCSASRMKGELHPSKNRS